MKYTPRDIKVWFNLFIDSPLTVFARIFQKICQRDNAPRVFQLRAITRETPLILQIETTNICNASCIFCAYPKMGRKKGIMSMALFQKVVKDYVAMGGGPVSLTPIMGDALLDPHLIERLQILKAHPEITQISLVTNAIALDSYSDKDVHYLLEALDSIMISIGGLDAETYKTMHGVDLFHRVSNATERLMRIKDILSPSAKLAFAFRTNDFKFESHYRKKIREYRKRGIFISHICNYANFSGAVQNDQNRKISVLMKDGHKRSTCVFPRLSMCVCWDGTITACGCADFEGSALIIGHAGKDALSEVWSGKKRWGIIDSFPKGTPSHFCRLCSAYQPDTVFVRPYFSNIHPHRPLPQDFFNQFWGG